MTPTTTPTPANAKVLPPVAAYIGIGANLGNARAAVLQAMRDLAVLAQTRVLKKSSLYRSAPIDSSGPNYINAVVEVRTSLSPQALLAALQNMEQGAGRERPYVNAPRTLDLDILLYGDVQLNSAELTIPHPRMTARAFVLLPLAELAPGLVSAAQLDAVRAQAIERLRG